MKPLGVPSRTTTPPRRRRLRAALAALAALAAAVPARPADKGSLAFSLWNRSYLYSDPYPGLRDNRETIFRLDFAQVLTNYGQIAIRTDGLFGTAGTKMSQWRLAWTGLRLGGLSVRALLGDDYLQVSTTGRRFINLFHPYVYFRGARLDAGGSWWEATAWGGRTARLMGLLGSSFDLTPQSLFGGKARVRSGDRFSIGAGYVHARGEEPVAWESGARENDLLLVDTEGRVAPGVEWLGEFRRTAYTENGTLARKAGSSFRLGPLVRTRSFSFEANYRRADPDFRFLGPMFPEERDEKGWFSTAQADFGRSVSAFATWDSYEDNLDGDAERPKTRTRRGLAGVSVFGRKWPDLTVRLERGGLTSPEGFADPVDATTAGSYIQVSDSFGALFPYARYSYQSLKNRRPGTTDWTWTTVTLGVRSTVARNASFWLEAVSDRRSSGWTPEPVDPSVPVDPWAEWVLKQRVLNTDARSLRAGFSRQFSPSIGVTSEVYYRQEETSPVRRTLEVYLASTIALARDWDLRFDVRGYIPISGAAASMSSYGITVKIDRRFGWGAPPRIVGRAGEGRPAGTGAIEGTVYEDLDQDLEMDSGETGVPGLLVLLEDGSTAETDESGRYRFPYVAEGAHSVRLEERGVPAGYFILSPLRLDALVVPRKSQREDFALLPGAGLSGTVAEDADGNGRVDPGEKGLPDVLVVLKPAGEARSGLGQALLQRSILNTFTGADGRFSFENIPPGEYSAEVDPETLPKGARIVSEHPMRLVLEPGKVLDGRDVAVAPRKIVIREGKAPRSGAGPPGPAR